MNATVSRTRASLLIVLLGGTLGWIFFIAGTYGDLVLRNRYTADELYGNEPVSLVYPSKYFTFLAVAALAVATLIAKRRLLRAQETAGSGRFHASVLIFTNVAMIVSLALAAVAGVSVFMSGFFNGFQTTEALPRVLDVYVPILLYTALLVGVILTGFVFLRHPAPPATAHHETAHALSSDSAPTESSRSLGFAYAIPIIAAAIALILGLIVYDITKTAPEVWIWVIIVSIVALGVVLGTRSARHAADTAHPGESDTSHAPDVTVGAINLNLVLSVVFAVVVSIMALGYGTSAVNSLQSQTYASLYVHDKEWVGIEGETDSRQITELTIQADGSGLEPASTATVTITPGNVGVSELTVDRTGYTYLEATEMPELDEGDYALTFAFTNEQGDAQSLALDFSVDNTGLVTFPDGAQTWYDTEKSTLLPMTFSWVLSDLLPAFLLWVLAMLVIYLTLSLRNNMPISQAPAGSAPSLTP